MNRSAADIRLFHRQLLAWYKQHGRHHLPWRHTPDPYPIYVSEVMLQQTQVETVLTRFYHPFLERFPTLAALAEAPAQEVVKAWEGLGYYNRARNLHEAAKLAAPALPPSVEELMALPGIGRNTAHAVAAFAWKQSVPVMEANVKRVLSRIFALSKPAEAELWQKADQLLDRNQPFEYNQAMMDVGAMLCARRVPLCAECPAAVICEGKINPAAYPAPKKTKRTPVRQRNIIVVRNRKGRFYATLRTGKFLSGLYRFIELEGDEDRLIMNGQLTRLTRTLLVGGVRQQYSHFTLEAKVYFTDFRSITHSNDWYDWQTLKALPMSGVEKKILSLLDTHLRL